MKATKVPVQAYTIEVSLTAEEALELSVAVNRFKNGLSLASEKKVVHQFYDALAFALESQP